MQRERLTPERIRRFACPDGVKQAFLWDTEAPRLAVRATAGAKSFVFESKLDRQTIRRTIGDVRAWTIDDARMEARRLQTLIDQGTDPRELDRQREAEKLAAKAAEEASLVEEERRKLHTLRALCNAYVAHLEAQGKKKSADATRSGFKCHVFTRQEIADTPAREVTAHQVAELVRKVREAGKERMAGVLRSYLNAAYNAAKAAPYDSRLPADFIPFGIEHNPVDAIPAIAVRAGNRTLTPDELRAYILALGNALPDQAMLIALLAGGQRMAQLLRAKVTEYSRDERALLLWDGKGRRATARPHLVPLGRRAAKLVEDLVDRAEALETPWIFTTDGSVPMTETTVSARVAKVAADMGGEPFDLRDVRRTVETMLAGMRVSKDVRSQLLSHGISGVQAVHYDRHTYFDEKRAALEAWESKIKSIEKGEKLPSNVRPLRRKKTAGA